MASDQVGKLAAQDKVICPGCVSIVGRRDPFCVVCTRPRPLRGWSPLDEEGDPWLGKLIKDEFFVSQRLGVGGTARVYRVESTKLARRFALKIVDLDATRMGESSEVEQRIRREIDVVRRLHSPHIVPLYDVFRVSRRSIGMLMGLAEGHTLQTIVRTDGPLAVREAVDITRQIATALSEPHSLGITHRDVKPENLMVQQLATGPFVRVMDFGIAHVDSEVELTRGFVGTPLYASPEQIEGRRIGPPSDIYSLGATLYFALTGVAPFAHTSHIAALRAHIIDPVPRLSDAGGRFFASELEGLVQRMLSKDPAERPQDMAELSAALDHVSSSPGFDDVFGDRSDISSVLVADSETIAAPRTTGGGLPRGMCMVPFPIEGQFASGGLAGMGAGRIISVVDDDVVVTTPSLGGEQRFPIDFAAVATAVAASDTRLFVGTRDGLVWSDRAGWQPIFETKDAAIAAIAVTPGSDTVAIGTEGGDVYVRTGTSDWEFVATGSPVRALAVSPTGSLLAVARWSGVRVTEVHGSEVFDIAEADVTSLCFSADEYLLATSTRSDQVAIWGLGGAANRLHSVEREDATVLALHFANETLLGLCRTDSGAFLVDLQCSKSSVCTPDCMKCHEI